MALKKQDLCIDIHSHILPGVDDGSKDMEQTMEMLKTAWNEGITHIVATPHYKHGRRNISPEDSMDLVQGVQAIANSKGIPITIYKGNEIFYFSGATEKLDESRISTMNNTDYVLVEFLPTESFSYIRNAFDQLIGMGYRPIIAHIERYSCMLKNKDYAQELHNMGVKIQVNADSIMGKFGFQLKMYTRALLKYELIDYIGTDAHNHDKRNPKMKDCRDFIYKKCSEDYADAILFKNAIDDFELEL